MAALIREGRINLDELHGLAEDKLRIIRDRAKAEVLTLLRSE
jgi:hypothetical protein